MEIGYGHLGFPPAIFWRMTFKEFQAAQNGYLEKIGAKKATQPMKRSEYLDLLKKYGTADTKSKIEGGLIQ